MSGSLQRFAGVAWLICLLVVPPMCAQSRKPAVPNADAQDQNAAAAATAPETEVKVPSAPPQYHPPAEVEGAPPAPTRHVNFGPDYSFGRAWFPNVAAPYWGRPVPQPNLSNTPRLDQLIHDGKLNLGVEDAISLALENNLSIAIERYTPWIDEAQLLYNKSGANGLTLFDPSVTSQLSLDQSDFPFPNPLFAGVLTTTPTPFGFKNDIATGNFGYTQGFATGTQAQVTFDNSRTSTNFGQEFLFNPYFQSSLGVELTQPLLRGFGKLPNTRYIIEGRNTVKIGASQFKQEVMAIISQVASTYWQLVYDREYIKIARVTVAADEQLYHNNQAAVRIGTMAPVEVITAQSQLAIDQQNLVLAQKSAMLQNAALLAVITKNAVRPMTQGVQIFPTTPIYNPPAESLNFQDAVKQALRIRPEMEQAELTLKNFGVEVKATKNLLLPNLSLFAQFQTDGLSGVANPNIPTGEFVGTNPVFGTSGVIPPGAVPTGYLGSELTVPGTPIHHGIVSGWDQLIHAQYPTLEAGLNLTLPIRNRAAQAQYAQAQLGERQQQVALQNTQQSIVLNVRQALLSLEEDRAAVAAAKEARIYNQQSYDDEVKQLQLGTSSAFTVVEKQVLLTQAEAAELTDRINVIEDEINLDQALGRTLEVHNISIAGAMSGKASAETVRPPEIPGTPDAMLAN
jgi:outer membrane protein